jgi:DNA polymerase-3 subunit gamma/tau
VALYRKYRPATFAEVVGQEHVTEPLSTALSAGRINHAYLFSGPRGCGKTSSARILARSLNCEQGPTPTPCGECASCLALAPNGGGSFDVVELDAASHGGVDDTRDLRDRASFAPAQSRYRIFIIDEAHMVTTQGFNALLKIVEEPPEHVIFVFATTEPEKVLATIRSRTHHYPFRLLAPKTMRGLVEKILASEDVEVDDAVFPLVIRAGGGSPRDTLSVLDQLLAGAQDNRVHYQRALALLGATDIALIDEAVDALAAGDAATLFGAVESVIDAGHDPRRFAIDLLERFRDLIVLQAVPDAASRGVVDAPGDVLERMRDQAARIGPATLARYAEVVHAGLGEMRGATAPRLLLEVVCARLLLPSASDTESALLQRVERIETRLDISIPAAEAAAGAGAPAGKQYVRRTQAAAAAPAPAAPAAPPLPVAEPAAAPETVAPVAPVPPLPPVKAPPTPVAEPAAAPEPVVPVAPAPPAAPPLPKPEPKSEPPVAPPPQPESTPEPLPAGAPVLAEPDAAAVRQMWPTVREKVRDRNKVLYALFEAATVRAVEGDTLVIAHPAPSLAKRLTEPRNVEIIRDALKDALGVNWRLRCEVGSGHPVPAAEPPPPEPQPDPVDTQRAEEDDMIAEARGDDSEAAPRRDPDEEALELVQKELGARRIDG